MGSMALIVFFRGINVGGHRAPRGTLVVRNPGLRAKFLAELRRKLPFEATIAFCHGSDLIRLERDDPFGSEPPPADSPRYFYRNLIAGDFTIARISWIASSNSSSAV